MPCYDPQMQNVFHRECVYHSVYTSCHTLYYDMKPQTCSSISSYIYTLASSAPCMWHVTIMGWGSLYLYVLHTVYSGYDTSVGHRMSYVSSVCGWMWHVTGMGWGSFYLCVLHTVYGGYDTSVCLCMSYVSSVCQCMWHVTVMGRGRF